MCCRSNRDCSAINAGTYIRYGTGMHRQRTVRIAQDIIHHSNAQQTAHEDSTPEIQITVDVLGATTVGIKIDVVCW